MYTCTIDELYHHGILGMKWGKKNGPPYPLDYKKLSPEERAAAKDKAIRQGNLKEAADNIDYYDNNELRAVKERFSLNQEIKGLNAQTIAKGKKNVGDQLDKIFKTAGKVADYSATTVKLYNQAAKAYNAFAAEKDQLPLIGEKKPHKNKAEGLSRGQLAEMMRKGGLTTKDYEDINNRLKNMNDAEKALNERARKPIYTVDQMKEMTNNPDKYTDEQWTEAQKRLENIAKVNNSTIIKAAKERDAEIADKKREEEDWYAFYNHSLDDPNALTHMKKGGQKKKHKYIKREWKNGHWVYYYADKAKQNTYERKKKQLEKEIAEYDERINKYDKQIKEFDKAGRSHDAKALEYEANSKSAAEKSKKVSKYDKKLSNELTKVSKDSSKGAQLAKGLSKQAKDNAYNTRQARSADKKARDKAAEALGRLEQERARDVMNSDTYKKAQKFKKWKAKGYALLSNILSHSEVTTMNDYILCNGALMPANELMHYGVLGMKWGVRRYQNPDGSLTAAGKAKYRSTSVGGNIGRAVLNGSLGQRVAVQANRGYKSDKKEITSIYKQKKKAIKTSETSDKATKKADLKSLKSDYKKTLGEARTAAAEVLYPWQGTKMNEKTQTQKLGKQIVKSFLAGDYGALTYDELRSKTDFGKGTSAAAGFLSGAANVYVNGLIGVADYGFSKSAYSKEQKALNGVSDRQAVKQYKKEENFNKLSGEKQDAKAIKAAQKKGLDQGDNWKVYRDAMRGDEKSKAIVKEWEKDPQATRSGNKDVADRATKAANKTSGPIAILTEEEAKKLGLDESTRVTGKEESDFWKAYAAAIEEEQRRKKRR